MTRKHRYLLPAAVGILAISGLFVHAWAQVYYDPDMTHMTPCMQVCDHGNTVTCSRFCRTSTADGGYSREYKVSSTGPSTAACLATLHTYCKHDKQ